MRFTTMVLGGHARPPGTGLGALRSTSLAGIGTDMTTETSCVDPSVSGYTNTRTHERRVGPGDPGPGDDRSCPRGPIVRSSEPVFGPMTPWTQIRQGNWRRS